MENSNLPELLKGELQQEEILEQQVQNFRETILSDEMLDFVKVCTNPFEEMYSRYNCAIMEVETKFKVLNEELGLKYDCNPIESIKSRLKSPNSLIRKVRDRKIPISIEEIEKNITDIAGVRVICSFPKDIYILEESFLRQDDVRLLKRKDYIANPKENGYRSLHLIVEVPIFLKEETKYMKVEVQLRTIAMDFWASLEHKLRYKKKRTPEQTQEINKELFECAEESARLDVRMQNLQIYLQDEDENQIIDISEILNSRPDQRKNL